MSSESEELVVNCFDLDGTLYNLKGGSFTESPLSSDLGDQIQGFLDEEIPDSDIGEEEFWYAARKGYAGEISLAVERLLEIPREEYFERTWGELEPQNYVEETFSYQDLFNELTSETNVLVTSAPEVWAKSLLSELEIEKYFSAIRTGEPEPRKPSSETFEQPIERALDSRKPYTIYFIGDQPSDFPESIRWDANTANVYVGKESPEGVKYTIENVMEFLEVRNLENSCRY